ncbi:membrane protein [Pseudomonas aeruginosa]|nr:membrane protein [Pseudomonas aeruginosa]
MKRSLFNCAHPFRQRWSIGCLAVALSCASLADEAPPAAAGAEPQRLVDINEYVVRGNTVLDNRAIEAAVYPFLGPQRSLGDIEGRAMRCRPPTRRRATSRSTSSCRSSR